MQVLKHVIGSPSQEDALILHEPSPENFVSLTKSKDQEYIFICSNSKTTSEVGLLGTLNRFYQLLMVPEDKHSVSVRLWHSHSSTCWL